MTARRPILVALDAFGTIFSPRKPIGEQYVSVAEEHGLKGLSVDGVNRSFKSAFKHMSQEHPNYGKISDMKSSNLWWYELINRTFSPHLSTEKQQMMPPGLAPALLHRFSSSLGYQVHDDAARLLEKLKSLRAQLAATDQQLVVGVLSNSDDRVPSILRSLGFQVSLPGLSDTPQAINAPTPNDHCQFVALSYDIGYEKPSAQIFDYAAVLVREYLISSSRKTCPITKLYIGDDVEKDIKGANDAGWHSILIDRNDKSIAGIKDPLQLFKRMESASKNGQVFNERVSSLLEPEN
ncbi:hypothetical protein BT63DRAFT_461120 [Microthyrium microscopicum]|uniref:HAD-like protein n=1 Tax=Microthyrium microscopicum TaxID=703497 RepID=A0A6A6TYD5_9PEZI|nr:hypothetical protein BT63DRAFT_461120 [Microthyrium microscopicum]